MDRLKVEANYRSDMSKSRRKAIRRQGYVTGSIFGRGAEPVSVEVPLDDLVEQIKHSEGGITSLIDMKIKNAPKKCDGIVMIKEFYKDPLTRKVLDIQFQRVNLKEKINVTVPIECVGEAKGTSEGGILDQVTTELQISCLPTDIPPKIEVDVSDLEVNHLIRVEDLQLGEEIEVITPGDTVVANCRPPTVVEEPEEGVEEEALEGEAAEEGAEAEGEAPAGEGEESSEG